MIFVIVGKMKTCDCNREVIYEKPENYGTVCCTGMKCDHREVYILYNQDCKQVIYEEEKK